MLKFEIVDPVYDVVIIVAAHCKVEKAIDTFTKELKKYDITADFDDYLRGEEQQASFFGTPSSSYMCLWLGEDKPDLKDPFYGGLIVHECYHALQNVFQRVATPLDEHYQEPAAHYIEFLYRTIALNIVTYNKIKKKKK